MAFISGLDLGKIADYSAIAVLEQTRQPVPGQPGRSETHYFVGYLHQFPLRTPYVSQAHGGRVETGIVESVRELFQRPQLRHTTLAIDQTGVGVAVVDFFRRASLPCQLRPITITSGHQVTEVREEFGFHVPKKELVSTLEVLMQNRRLTVAKGLPQGEVLRAELANFQMKITRHANEVHGAWREGQHDDLVLAVALACWLGEKVCLDWDGTLGHHPAASRSPFAAPPAGTFAGGSFKNPPKW